MNRSQSIQNHTDGRADAGRDRHEERDQRHHERVHRRGQEAHVFRRVGPSEERGLEVWQSLDRQVDDQRREKADGQRGGSPDQSPQPRRARIGDSLLSYYCRIHLVQSIRNEYENRMRFGLAFS